MPAGPDRALHVYHILRIRSALVGASQDVDNVVPPDIPERVRGIIGSGDAGENIAIFTDEAVQARLSDITGARRFPVLENRVAQIVDGDVVLGDGLMSRNLADGGVNQIGHRRSGGIVPDKVLPKLHHHRVGGILADEIQEGPDNTNISPVYQELQGDGHIC